MGNADPSVLGNYLRLSRLSRYYELKLLYLSLLTFAILSGACVAILLQLCQR